MKRTAEQARKYLKHDAERLHQFVHRSIATDVVDVLAWLRGNRFDSVAEQFVRTMRTGAKGFLEKFQPGELDGDVVSSPTGDRVGMRAYERALARIRTTVWRLHKYGKTTPRTTNLPQSE